MAIYSADELERSRDALIKLHRLRSGYPSSTSLLHLVEAQLQTFIISGVSPGALEIWIAAESDEARRRIALPHISVHGA